MPKWLVGCSGSSLALASLWALVYRGIEPHRDPGQRHPPGERRPNHRLRPTTPGLNTRPTMPNGEASQKTLDQSKVPNGEANQRLLKERPLRRQQCKDTFVKIMFFVRFKLRLILQNFSFNHLLKLYVFLNFVWNLQFQSKQLLCKVPKILKSRE